MGGLLGGVGVGVVIFVKIRIHKLDRNCVSFVSCVMVKLIHE